MSTRDEVLRFAIRSRLYLILLQIIFNAICPDHNADAFRAPEDPRQVTSIFDKVVSFLLGGLTRWDSEYYLHIARHGYTYENTLAFLPLFPMAVRVLGFPLRHILFFLYDRSALTVAAVTLNFFCFVKSAVTLYDLSAAILSKRLAHRAAILYCLSPASVFLTAAYTEPMFAYLTFYSMLSAIQKSPYVAIPIGLSSIVRSNGLVNLGFPVFTWLQEAARAAAILCSSLMTKRTTVVKKIGEVVSFLCFQGIPLISRLIKVVLVSVAPFLLLQTYNYVLFCTEAANSTKIPGFLKEFGEKEGLVTPGGGFPVWCSYKFPSAYGYIQEKYWNVGFFKYYELKQLPNFTLAAPILFLMLKACWEYIKQNKREVFSLQVLRISSDEKEEDVKKNKKGTNKEFPTNMFPFIAHGLFLTIFCILFVHIQVSTRLLSSASPLLYWYSAILISRKEGKDSEDELWSTGNVFSVFRNRTAVQKLLLGYFLGYAIVGTFMFSNFLPWT